MFKPLLTTASLLLLLPFALGECGYHYFGHCEDMITHWYDPLTGEVCDLLDCGGGRAPPKTDVPGCGDIPALPTTVSFMSCWTEGWMLPTGEGTKGIRPVITADWIMTTAGVKAPVKMSPVETSAMETSTMETGMWETTASPKTSTTAAAAVSTGEAASASTKKTAESSAVTLTTPLASPSTTGLAVLPTLTRNGTATLTTVSSTPEATKNAGSFVGGSLVAVMGTVVGVIAFM
ncbi:hypothetical protein VE00_05628 [Pseudogymnoascus sp. WSF 3629]|nr:hypothetical protein VE00_05628 [Pseudogymnoascus sp. WSF 3629]